MMRCEFNINGQCIHDTGTEKVACGTCPYSFEEGACRCAMFAPHEPNSKLSYFEKRASWDDVAAKGRAIVASDGVEIIRDDAQEVEAWVMSGQLEGQLNDLGRKIDITDGGPYDVILSKKSWQRKTNVGGWVQGYLCDCDWGKWHSGSPGDSPNFVRFCSHAYALMLYKNMRARKDFLGASVIDRENFIKDACDGKHVGSVEDKGNYQIVRDGDKVAIRIKRASADCYINGLLGFSIDTGDEVKVNILAWYPDDDGEMHIKVCADSGESGGFYDVDGIHYVGDGYGYSIESALEAALWRCGVELDERIERIVDMIDDSLWGQLVAKRKKAFTQPKILDPSSNAYTALEEVCRVLSMHYPECEFAIENIYFDYGQDWRWTNIVCYKPDGYSFQVLNPKEFEILVETYNVDYVVELIESDKYWPLRAKGASVKVAEPYDVVEYHIWGECMESYNDVEAKMRAYGKDEDGCYSVYISYFDEDGEYYRGDGWDFTIEDAFETACYYARFEPFDDGMDNVELLESMLCD